MATKTKAKKTAAVRYDDATVKKIAVFLKNHSNQAAKKEFGCSAHFAGRVRDDHKIPPFVAPSAVKSKSKVGKKGKVKSDLL